MQRYFYSATRAPALNSLVSALSEKRGKARLSRSSFISSVNSRPRSEMVVSRALLLALALVAARGNIASHDNILRIQLWDADGLSKLPLSTAPPANTVTRWKSKVSLHSLYDAMVYEGHGGGGRFTRHKARHKRRRPRRSGSDLPWRFHAGDHPLNVAVYDGDLPWSAIEAGSAVSVGEVNGSRDVPAPMTLRQDDEVMGKQSSLSALSPPQVANAHSPLIASGVLFMPPFQLRPRRRCVGTSEWPSLFFQDIPACRVIVSRCSRMECKYFSRGTPCLLKGGRCRAIDV